MRNNIENEDGLELFGRLLVVLAVIGALSLVGWIVRGVWKWMI